MCFLVCLVTFGIGFQERERNSIFILKPDWFSSAEYKAIFGKSLFPKSVPVGNFSVNEHGQPGSSQNGHEFFGYNLVPEQHCMGFFSRCQYGARHREPTWRWLKGYSERVHSKTNTNPHPHIISGGLPAIPDLNLNLWCTLLEECDLCAGLADVGPLVSYSGITHRIEQLVSLLPSGNHLHHLLLVDIGLAVNGIESPPKNAPLPKEDSSLQERGDDEQPCKYLYPPFYLDLLIALLCMGIAGFGGYVSSGRHRLVGVLIGIFGVVGLGCDLSTAAFGKPLFVWTLRWLSGQSHSEKCSGEYHGINVSQKYLTIQYFCNTVIGMANYYIKTSKSR